MITFIGAPVVWASKNQGIISLSNREAAYIALDAAIQMVQATNRMMTGFGIADKGGCSLKTDNHATVLKVNQPHGSKRRKLIDLRHH